MVKHSTSLKHKILNNIIIKNDIAGNAVKTNRICNYSSIQAFKYSSAQAFDYSSIHVFMYSSIQALKYSSIQVLYYIILLRYIILYDIVYFPIERWRAADGRLIL